MCVDEDEIAPACEIANGGGGIDKPIRTIPAEMGVPESAQPSKAVSRPDDRRMRIAVVIAMPMMQAMDGDPVEWRDAAHAAQKHQDAFDRPERAERMVGEQAMVAEREAEAGRQ